MSDHEYFLELLMQDSLPSEQEPIAHKFDRFIAKVKADALREAATEFEARLPDGTGNGRAYNSYRVAEMLSARADRIEEEA